MKMHYDKLEETMSWKIKKPHTFCDNPAGREAAKRENDAIEKARQRQRKQKEGK